MDITKFLEEQMNVMVQCMEDSVHKGDKNSEFYYLGRIDQLKRILEELKGA